MSAEWSLAGYTELGELGRGGFGRVVAARHDASGAQVAVKYLAADLLADDRARAQFRAEAAMLARLSDPHVVRLHAFAEEPGGAAIVMELVDGVALRALLAGHGATAPEAALVVLKGSLLGLRAAHSVGVVHRDYKPENVLVRPNGQSTLVDFGIAVLSGSAGSPIGTAAYMAPEQWNGRPASPATDVYAATCVFFECVTGRKPFEADDVQMLRAQHLTSPVPLADVPAPVRDLVARGMAKSQGDRPAGAGAFTEELERAAIAGYGTGWEASGKRHLAEAAAALTALFPLALLSGGLPGTGGVGSAAGQAVGASGKTLLGKAGVKAGIAVLGAAAVGGAALVVTTGDEEPERPPQAVASPVSTVAPPGKQMDLGRFSLTVPVGWTIRNIEPAWGAQGVKNTGAEIRLPGKCFTRRKPEPFEGWGDCPKLTIYKTSFWPTRPQPGGAAPAKPDLKQPHAGAFHTDVSLAPCPPRPGLYAGKQDMSSRLGTREAGARLTSKTLAPVGPGRKAYYREWRINCYKLISFTGNGGMGSFKRMGVSYTERTWWLPESKVLIVDNWLTPDLPGILGKAKWE